MRDESARLTAEVVLIADHNGEARHGRAAEFLV